MSELTDAIAKVKLAAEGAESTPVKKASPTPEVSKLTKRAKILEDLGLAGVKTAASEPNDMELAKMAAYEMATDALEKLAFADQLFTEADYIDTVYVKQASDGADMELNTNGEAIEAFLQELDTEVGSDE